MIPMATEENNNKIGGEFKCGLSFAAHTLLAIPKYITYLGLRSGESLVWC